MRRMWLALLVLVLAFVMVVPAVAFAAENDPGGGFTVTWEAVVPLGFIVLAVVDALKREYADGTGHELKRHWVILSAFLVGASIAVFDAYWSAFPPWAQLVLGGGALGLTVSGVVKFGDYGADMIAKARSAPSA